MALNACAGKWLRMRGLFAAQRRAAFAKERFMITAESASNVRHPTPTSGKSRAATGEVHT